MWSEEVMVMEMAAVFIQPIGVALLSILVAMLVIVMTLLVQMDGGAVTVTTQKEFAKL
jgi:hypothetical protein